jgi:hypothetical protein
MAMDGHRRHATAVTTTPVRTALGTAPRTPSTVTVLASSTNAVGNPA